MRKNKVQIPEKKLMTKQIPYVPPASGYGVVSVFFLAVITSPIWITMGLLSGVEAFIRSTVHYFRNNKVIATTKAEHPEYSSEIEEDSEETENNEAQMPLTDVELKELKPIHFASYTSNKQAISDLTQANVNIYEKLESGRYEGYTPLMIACLNENLNFDIIQTLINHEEPFDINQHQTDDGNSLLHILAQGNHTYEVLNNFFRTLDNQILKDIDFNQLQYNKLTPLEFSYQQGNDGFFRAILNRYVQSYVFGESHESLLADLQRYLALEFSNSKRTLSNITTLEEGVREHFKHTRAIKDEETAEYIEEALKLFNQATIETFYNKLHELNREITHEEIGNSYFNHCLDQDNLDHFLKNMSSEDLSLLEFDQLTDITSRNKSYWYGIYKGHEKYNAFTPLEYAHLKNDEDFFFKMLGAYILMKAEGFENKSLRNDLRHFIYLDINHRVDNLITYIQEATKYANDLCEKRENEIEKPTIKATSKNIRELLLEPNYFKDLSNEYLEARKEKAITNTKKFLLLGIPSFGLSIIIGIPLIWAKFHFEKNQDSKQIEQLSNSTQKNITSTYRTSSSFESEDSNTSNVSLSGYAQKFSSGTKKRKFLIETLSEEESANQRSEEKIDYRHSV